MKLKKITIFILILTLCISLCSCKSRPREKQEETGQKGAREVSAVSEAPKPKPLQAPESKADPEKSKDMKLANDIADDFLKAAKTGERVQIQEYADYNTLFGLVEGQDADWILQQVLMRMKYEVQFSELSGDEAAVSVKFSNVDMNVVMPLYFEQAMSLEYNNALSASPMDAAALEREYRKIFVSLMSAHNEGRVEKLVDVHLDKDDGAWKIKSELAVGNAMLGGYHEAREKFTQDLMAQAEAFQQPEAQQAETSAQSDDGENSGDEEEFTMVKPRE